jgi:hypothetical protein
MSNNKKSKKDEPNRADHGQNEQERIEGEGGKGIKFPTREHKYEGVERSKGKGGTAVPNDAATKPKRKAA